MKYDVAYPEKDRNGVLRTGKTSVPVSSLPSPPLNHHEVRRLYRLPSRPRRIGVGIRPVGCTLENMVR